MKFVTGIPIAPLLAGLLCPSIFGQDGSDSSPVVPSQVTSENPVSSSFKPEFNTLETTVVTAQPPISYDESKPVRSKVRQSNLSQASLPSLVIDDTAPAILDEQLILTASRVVESSFMSPFVTDSISQSDLIQRSVRSVPEALEQTPGVVVQKTSHGQGSPIIRGFTGHHNLFLIDGVRLNNSVFRSGPNQYWNTVDSQGLAGIELVKSQGAVLYGSDSVGGTVQALTRRPQYTEQGSFAGGRSFSRFATAENSLIQRGEYSFSEAGKYGLILGGTYKDFGDIKAADLRTLPFTGYDEWDMDAKLELFPTDDTRLTLFHQEVHIDDAWRVHKTRFGRSFAGTTIGSENARILDQHRLLSYIQWEGETSRPLFDHFSVNVSHQRQDEERYRDRNDRRVDIQGFTVDSYGIAAQFDSYLEHSDLTYGVSYYQDRIDSFRNDFNADGSFKGSKIQGPVGDDGRYDLASAFVNSSIEINDRTQLDIGTRYTYAAADVRQVQDPLSGNQISIDDSWQNVVSSGRVSYQLDDLDRFRLFGAISQGFRAPNLSDLSRLDSNRSTEIETPAPNLDPETFLTYELGVKAQTGDVSGTLSYFYTDVNDLILRTPTGRLVDGLEEVTKLNSGDGHVQGVELSLAYQWTDQVELFGGFAYQDSRVTTFPTSAPILKKEVLSRIMPTNGFAGVRRESHDERFWLEGIVRVVDRADRLSTRDLRDTQRIPPGGTPGYSVATIRSGWQATEDIKITGAVENIFDEAYRAHGSGQNEPGVGFIIGAEVNF